MSKLKEIIREIINEELDSIDEKLTDYMPGKMNAAADQAKKQGLEYAGFGRWKNQQGKVVAKTVDGRLQKVDINMGQQDPKDRNPKTKPIDPSKPVGSPKDMKEKVRWAARTKVAKAYENPQVQQAARDGTEFTGQQMTRLTGIPEKAFAAGHNAIDGSGVKILGLSDVGNSSDTIHYNPETKKYTFVSDKYLSTSSTSGNSGNDSPDPEKIDKLINAVGARISKSGVLNTHAGQDIPIDKFEKMTGISRKAAQKYSDTNDGPEADFSYDEETGMVTIQSPEGREDWGA